MSCLCITVMFPGWVDEELEVSNERRGSPYLRDSESEGRLPCARGTLYDQGVLVLCHFHNEQRFHQESDRDTEDTRELSLRMTEKWTAAVTRQKKRRKGVAKSKEERGKSISTYRQ